MRTIDKIVDKMDSDMVDKTVLATIIKIARSRRLVAVQALYDNGDITLDEALEILRGRLNPNDDSTTYDDSALLRV